jgi:hypothetical protein
MRRIALGLAIAGLTAAAALPMAATANAVSRTMGPYETVQECKQTRSNYARYYHTSECWAGAYEFYFVYDL